MAQLQTPSTGCDVVIGPPVATPQTVHLQRATSATEVPIEAGEAAQHEDMQEGLLLQLFIGHRRRNTNKPETSAPHAEQKTQGVAMEEVTLNTYQIACRI